MKKKERVNRRPAKCNDEKQSVSQCGSGCGDDEGDDEERMAVGGKIVKKREQKRERQIKSVSSRESERRKKR